LTRPIAAIEPALLFHAALLFQGVMLLFILISPVMSRAAERGGHAASQQRPILLGQVASRTGNNPGGLDNEQGAALAAAQINASGGLLGGRHIELHVEDDQTQAAPAIAAVERLAGMGVSAIVGTSFSNASLAVIPTVERARIPYISTGAADAQVEPVHPYVYMTPLTGQLVAEQLLRYLQSKGVTKLAVIYDSDSQFARNGWTKQRAMLARYAIELVAEQSVKVDTTDFGAALQAVSSSGAQALMAWVTGPPAVGLAKYHGRSGVHLPLYLSHGAASPAFVQAVGDAAEGITVATALAAVAPQLPESNARRVALAMTQSFEKAYGHLPSQFAIDGYVAVKLVAAAIEQAGSDEPTAIQRALDHLNLVTPQGEYRYSPTDHSGLRVDDVAITEIRQGHFVLTAWSKERMALGSRE
jgi:branched-chain amino acid transport system substrate-binding protein